MPNDLSSITPLANGIAPPPEPDDATEENGAPPPPPVGPESDAATQPNPSTGEWICDASIPGIIISAHTKASGWPLVVRSVEDLQWGEFTPISPNSPNTIPTTVLYQGKAWCVEEIKHCRERFWVYRLRLWPDGEPWIKIFELNEAAIQKAEKEVRKFNAMRRRSQYGWIWEPFVGFLPAFLQVFLSYRLHFDAEQASRKNALFHFYLFFGLAMAGSTDIVAACIGYEPFIMARDVLILVAFAMEGLFRWAHVCASSEPCGFSPFEIPCYLFKELWYIGKHFPRGTP